MDVFINWVKIIEEKYARSTRIYSFYLKKRNLMTSSFVFLHANHISVFNNSKTIYLIKS